MNENKWLGHINIWQNGHMEFEGSFGKHPNVDEIGLIYRAMVGAQAAIRNGGDAKSIAHQAASLLARIGAEKARERRRVAEQEAVEAQG